MRLECAHWPSPLIKHIAAPAPSCHAMGFLLLLGGRGQMPAAAGIRKFCAIADQHQHAMQILVLASVMLLIGSLSSVAVPRLSGKLIDISIDYSQSGEEAQAKRQANRE